jgi:anti-sigma regulatory factor (Ser/Thr protein kinase)
MEGLTAAAAMQTTSIRVDGADQAGEARRRAALLSRVVGLDEATAGRVAIVVTELANNLWKHAGGGEILVTQCGAPAPCIEVLALDTGPGMPDLARCFQDGYSTAGSSGTGLGAVQRLSSEWDVYTVSGKGSAILARIRPPAAPPSQGRIEIGGVSVPLKGETVCGDTYALAERGGVPSLLVVDGLGHGPGAADCAEAAVTAFHETETDTPAESMRDVHAALRATRGAAVSIARIDYGRGELLYSGIGNIAGVIWSHEGGKHLLAHPGIVGNDVRNVRELTYELPAAAIVLLYSDGISTHWSLSSYEGLSLRDPALIAGVIYRDHSRRRDDATVVVVRARQS